MDTTKDYDVTNFIEAIKQEAKKSENPTDTLLKKLESAEKMRRDTQASYTTTRQRLKALEKEREMLRAKIKPGVVSDETLEDLKLSDPDAWYRELQKREKQASLALAQELEDFSNKTQAEIELEERKAILRSFTEANPDFDITSQEVQDQIPPKLLKQLETGTVSFADFLNKAKKFVETPKVIGEVPKVPEVDLGKMAGSATPPPADKVDVAESYSNLVF